MANLRQTPLTCSGHTRPVVDLAFSDVTPYGYFMISACKDGKPMIRQGDTGDWIGTFEGHKGAVWGATLNRDATRAATGAADFSAKIWDAEKGEELQTFTHKHIVKSVDFNKDGTLLLTGSNEKLLRVFDLGKPDSEPRAFAGHTSNIKGALFLGDAKKIISASDDKTVRLWTLETCQEIQQLTFDSAPTSLALSPSGNTIIVTYGQSIAFYNVDTLMEIKKFEADAPINSVSLHHSEKFFVAGGEDFKMYKFDYDTGKEIESFKGHFGPVHCVRFSPDGELYASGSEDGTLRLWQTTVGKTYGLWKCIIPDEAVAPTTNDLHSNAAQEVKVES